jgi:hypothetical protein
LLTGHDQFVDRWLVVLSGAQAGKVSDVDDGSAAEEHRVGRDVIEREGRFGQTSAVAGQAGCEDAAGADLRRAAGEGSGNGRVVCTWPSFLGQPWIQPRAMEVSRST